MRRVFLGDPNVPLKADFERWAVQAIKEIENASISDSAAEVASDFNLGTYTPTTTLNPGTATVADVANVLCTLLAAMQKKG